MVWQQLSNSIRPSTNYLMVFMRRLRVKGVLLSHGGHHAIGGERHVTIAWRPPNDSLGPFINSNMGVTKQ
jgi:hypothetical protein